MSESKTEELSGDPGTEPRPYRQGMICEVAGTQYWHTGSRYFVAIGMDGHERDLRDYDGFADSEARRLADKYIGFTCDDWESEVGNADAVKAALTVVQHAKETLYWNAVARFLKVHDGTLERRKAAIKVLRAAGFDEDSVRSVLGLCS